MFLARGVGVHAGRHVVILDLGGISFDLPAYCAVLLVDCQPAAAKTLCVVATLLCEDDHVLIEHRRDARSVFRIDGPKRLLPQFIALMVQLDQGELSCCGPQYVQGLGVHGWRGGCICVERIHGILSELIVLLPEHLPSLGIQPNNGCCGIALVRARDKDSVPP